MKKGDIITNEGRYRKVLETLRDILFLTYCHSNVEEIKNAVWGPIHIDELSDWTVVELVWSANELKDDDEYWFINDFGILLSSSWQNDIADTYRLRTNNIYQTREAAQAALDKIMQD